MSNIKQITLYSYFYSSAAWRVRAVLNLKGIPYKYETIHLLKGDQHSEEYLKKNPMHQVPTIKIEDADGKEHYLWQSLPIIEYFEELYPEKSVLPKDPILKAKARAIAETISGGIQPLQNLETLVEHETPLGRTPLTSDERQKVAAFWIDRKLKNLDLVVATTAGKYCVGDSPTIADFTLVPQMFNARRFGLDTSNYPTLHAIDQRLNELDIIKNTHPFTCPDAPKN